MRLAQRRELVHAALENREPTSEELYHPTEAELHQAKKIAEKLKQEALGRWHPVKRMYRAPRRNPIVLPLFIAGTILAVTATLNILAWREIQVTTDWKPQSLAAVVTSVAVIAATTGWIANLWLTHRLNATKHTIDFVSGRFYNKEFNEAVKIFNLYFRTRSVTTKIIEELDQTDREVDQAVIQSVKYLLNYFEFIAVGLAEGVLDYEIVRKSLRGNIVYYYDKCRPYIADLCEKNSDTLKNLRDLRLDFETDF